MNLFDLIILSCNNKIIPISSVYSFSNMQQIYLICQKLCEIIAKVNNYDDILLSLKDYLTNLDKDIENVVTAEIKKLYDDGTLADMLNANFKESFDKLQNELRSQYDYARTKELDLRRVQRMIIGSGNHYYFATKDKAYYSYPQGCCRYVKNGIEYYAILRMPRNAPFTHNNLCELCVYQAGFPTILKHKQIDCGHGQAITYDNVNDCFYISVYLRKRDDETQYTSKQLIKVNESDLTTNELMVKGFPHEYYGLKFLDGVLYGTEGNFIYKIDFDNSTDEVYLQIPTEYSLETYQPHGNGWTMNKDFYFIATFIPNQLLVISRNNNKLFWKYEIPNIIENGHPIGEIESIDCDDEGNLWVFTGMPLAGPAFSQEDITQVFYTNLKNNGGGYYTTLSDIYRSQKALELYVDPTKYKEAVNPNGTKENPFTRIQEAINFATHSDYGMAFISCCNPDFTVVDVESPRCTIDLTYMTTDWKSPPPGERIQVGGVINRGGNIKMNGFEIVPYNDMCNLGCSETTYTNEGMFFNCVARPKQGYTSQSGFFVQHGQQILGLVETEEEFNSAQGVPEIANGRGGFTLKTQYPVD